MAKYNPQRKYTIMDTPCPKCGDTHPKVRQMRTKTGLYCSKCNQFIRYIRDDEMWRITKESRLASKNDKGSAFKRVLKDDQTGITRIRCSNCRCQLFNSNAPEPIGQFNLKDAKFCPLCGSNFVME